MSSNPIPGVNLYPYQPSYGAACAFAAAVGGSTISHFVQNFQYRYWRITFFVFWAGVVTCAGWSLRAASSQSPANLGLYIAATVCTYAGPPIYAAVEYNILGRLMSYLPMHAPLHPRRLKYFFIYLGALVEALTGAGAGRMAASRPGSSDYKSGGLLLGVSLILQGAVEFGFVYMVYLMYSRAKKAGMLTRNVKTICITLYGCSTLVLVRCVCRAVETFERYGSDCEDFYCGTLVRHEWFIYIFEASPMLLYTLWFNVLHPGRFLPREPNRYLDIDARTERMGCGWIDERPKWLTFVDPFNSMKDHRASGEHIRFWNRPQEWPACEDGSFAQGTATNDRWATRRNSDHRSNKVEEAGHN